MPASTLLALALVACKPEETEDAAPGVLADDLAEGVGVSVYGTIGEAPASAIVVRTNAAGAPVAGVAAELTVDGEPASVTFDTTGYGKVTLDAPGTVTIEGGEAPASLTAVGVAWEGFGMLRAEAAPILASRAVASHRGALVASADEAWWTAPGQAAHRVLRPDATIQGLRAAHLDLDGVLDAVVWAGDTVYLLKGRSAGGYAFGAAVRAEGYLAVAADVADVNSDDSPDLVVAWDGQERPHVQVLLGDGLWGFASRPARDLSSTPLALSIGLDDGSDARPQITVLRDGGDWTRLVWGDGNVIETGPTLATALPDAVWMDGGNDLNNDGGDEIVFVGERFADQPRDVRIFDLVGASPSVLPLQPLEAFLSYADADQDGVTDLLMSYGDGEAVIVTNPGTGWDQTTYGHYGDHGPLVTVDVTGDTLTDTLVAGDWWRWWDGAITPNSEGIDRYVAAAPALGTTALPAGSRIAAIEVDGDPLTREMVGLSVAGNLTRLVAWRVGSGSLSEVWATTVANDAAAVDLAVCGDVVWALTSAGATRVSAADGAITAQSGTSGAAIACASGASPEAVVLGADAYTPLAADGVASAAVAAVGARDIALADLGDGMSPRTCAEDGCVVAAWAYGAQGEQALITVTGAGASLQVASGSSDLPIRGTPGFADVDGDGNTDMVIPQIIGEHSLVGVWRSSGVGFGPAELFHLPEAIARIGAIGDVDGDGTGDLWAQDADGDWIVTGPR